MNEPKVVPEVRDPNVVMDILQDAWEHYDRNDQRLDGTAKALAQLLDPGVPDVHPEAYAWELINEGYDAHDARVALGRLRNLARDIEAGLPAAARIVRECAEVLEGVMPQRA